MSKTLNDICELIVDSEHKTAPTQEVGFPMVRTPNIGSGRLIWDKMRFVSQDNFLKWTRRAVPRVDDLILAREAPVGNVIRVPEDSKFCLGQRTVLLRPNRSVVDAKYLMYYLLSPNVRERLLAVSYGATVDHLNMADIRSLDVSDMPSLEQQKIISSRLSVFDDLIEVNGRRIKVLEEMARRIYREWFIDFKYPDHEKVKMVDSGHPDFGMIPEGWFVKRLSDLMDIKGGSQPAKSEWSKESKAGHVRMVQIRDYESDKYIEYVKDTPKLRKCEEHDVMIARYGASVGRICDGLNGAYNVALVKVLPKRAEVLEFLRYFLRDNFFQQLIVGMSGRAAQAGFNKTTFNSVNLAVPEDSDLFENFNELVVPMYDLKLNLKAELRNLSNMRDLLLPRLVSGDIDVSDLDFEELTTGLNTQTNDSYIHLVQNRGDS